WRVSARFRPDARTRTRTSPGPGSRTSRVPIVRTSGPPLPRMLTASTSLGISESPRGIVQARRGGVDVAHSTRAENRDVVRPTMFLWLSNLITLPEKRSFHGETVIFFALFVGTMRLLLEVFLVGFQGVPLLRNELLYVSWY